MYYLQSFKTYSTETPFHFDKCYMTYAGVEFKTYFQGH